MEPVIEVSNLRKTYGSLTAVEAVSFSVERGEIFGILGPNGAGKTTTVECMQGLRRADGGTVRVLGLDPQSEADRLRPRVGAQLQQSALPARIKVWEALDLFASFVPGGTDWRRLLDQWGLVDKRNASFVSLSGGQQQRLLVALALVNDPEVVFLDEMTTGLDPQARRVAWDLIGEMRDGGATVVLVTHFMDEAERLCDRLLVLNRGRVEAIGSPRSLVTGFEGEVSVTFTAGTADVSWLEEVEGVGSVGRHGDLIEVTGKRRMVPQLGAALVRHGVPADDMSVREPGLEDVYLALVGGASEEP